MQRPRINILIKSQAGIGYVAILVLLAILSTMGLAFIYKVGLMSSVTLNRGTSIQAHYLAESAANHALWRLLNDPGFTPESDKYYMHSLANGRYGYNVRKPTETTFATVATVGAMGDIATQQSYVQYIIPSNVLSAYARTTTPTIQYRRLIGAHWTDPADTPDIPIPTVYWVEMEGCPIRKEIIMGSIDGPDDINLVVWDGVSWGNPHTFGQDANKNYKCFDIAYESQSGNALVVGRTDGTATVRYNVWDGTAWLHATAQPAYNLAGGEARLVVMASCPGNDQILIATVNSLFDLQLFLWNGSVFTDLGVIETSTHSDQPGTVQIVYEQQSGNALVIWTKWSETPKFRVWNGVTLGPENVVPIFPNDVYFLRAAGDPTSDHIVVAGVDKFYDVQVGIWDGTAWPDSREVETDNANQVRQSVDVAWEASGEDALVVWAPWSSGSPIVRSLAWKKGTALADSTVEPGPDLQNQPWLVRLLPISQSEKIILLVENNTNDLRYSLWDGERLKGDPGILLESDISVQNELAFDLAEANVPRTGGTGTGVGSNLTPVVDAGPDQTLIYPTMETSLDGTVTDDGLPNPPAAVTTTWSLVSGPGTAVFGDASQVDTKITVSAPGAYVLRLTADDSELSAFDEITITISELCTILFVVPDELSLGSLDSARKALLESWGYAVVPFTAAKPQEDYDLAVSNVDVVYVSSTVYYADVTSKLKWLPVGVVNEVSTLTAYLGFTSGSSGTSGTQTAIVDNTHEITSPFSTGNLTITSSTQSLHRFVNTIGPGLQTLSTTTWSADRMLMTLDEGDELLWGGVAPARRVMLPWGGKTFDVSELNDNGKTIMKRAIEWAAEGACSARCDGLVGYWKLDETSGTVASDSSGSGNQGTLNNMDPATDWVSGHLDGALDFDGVNDYIDISVMNPRDYDDFTISAWYRSTDTSVSDDEYIFYHNFNYEDEVVFGPTDDQPDRLRLGINIDNSWNAYYGTSDIVDQQWHHLVAVRGGGRVKLYVDGVKETDDPDSDAGQTVSVNGNGPFIGNYPGLTEQVHGILDEVRIYNRALTPTEIVALHALTVGSECGGGGPDNDPPTPDPMTWAKPPQASGSTTIGMMATTATDPNGVEYYFECTEGGGNDSGWQDSVTYADTGLSSSTSYTYRVKARDKSASQNETGWSAEASATTTSNVMYVQDIAMGYRNQKDKYYGRATVWIRSEGGANISGAVVSATWSGSVTGTSMGTTGSDGKVLLESPEKKNGGTFKFTVTNVTKLGYVYNSSLNVETEDSITAP